MIREHRNREKLINYYKTFTAKGIIDPNVHPWIAKSWQKSHEHQVNPKKIPSSARLSPAELSQMQNKHSDAINYLDHFIDNIIDFIHEYDLCLTLMTADCVVLKKYANITSRLIDKLEGVSLSVENVGTLSCNIVKETKTPFWIFGPEIWLE
ncbi:MAG TPA: Fis family transcriptional regulator, partial [Megamonas hypermegale]|nr:Fis family transcriptional regulator [Megamonas hypermegale]